jgi:hypothetical protein
MFVIMHHNMSKTYIKDIFYRNKCQCLNWGKKLEGMLKVKKQKSYTLRFKFLLIRIKL